MDLWTIISIIFASGCVGAGLLILVLLTFALWLKWGDKENK
jgi:hypothetical protein